MFESSSVQPDRNCGYMLTHSEWKRGNYSRREFQGSRFTRSSGMSGYSCLTSSRLSRLQRVYASVSTIRWHPFGQTSLFLRALDTVTTTKIQGRKFAFSGALRGLYPLGQSQPQIIRQCQHKPGNTYRKKKQQLLERRRFSSLAFLLCFASHSSKAWSSCP